MAEQDPTTATNETAGTPGYQRTKRMLADLHEKIAAQRQAARSR